METIVQHLIQINLYLIAFYLVYAVLLRKETHFKLNRFYLLTSLIIAIGLPFLQLPASTIESVQNTEVAKTTQELFEAPSFFLRDASQQKTSVLNWIIGCYLLGVCLMLGRFIMGLWSIIRLITKSELEKHQGYYWVKTPMATKPFSFFKYLFWDDPTKVTATEAQQIQTHELAHIQQWHSLDILLLEVLHIVFWYNPICWLYKSAIRNIHEYLADESIINKGSDRVNYSELLLGQFFQSDHIFLTSQFLHKSILKSRIMMLHKVKSKRKTMLKVLWAMPILALFIFVQACSHNMINTEQITTEVPEGWDIANTIQLKNEVNQEFTINELSANMNVLISLHTATKETNGIQIDVYKEGKKVASNVYNKKFYSELYYKNREGDSLTLKITQPKNAPAAKLVIGLREGKKQ